MPQAPAETGQSALRRPFPGLHRPSITREGQGLRVYLGSTTVRIWHSENAGATLTQLDITGVPNTKIPTIAVDLDGTPGDSMSHWRKCDLPPLQRWRRPLAGAVTWFDASGALPYVSLPNLPLTGLALHPIQDEVIYGSTLLARALPRTAATHGPRSTRDCRTVCRRFDVRAGNRTR